MIRGPGWSQQSPQAPGRGSEDSNRCPRQIRRLQARDRATGPTSSSAANGQVRSLTFIYVQDPFVLFLSGFFKFLVDCPRIFVTFILSQKHLLISLTTVAPTAVTGPVPPSITVVVPNAYI